MTYLPDYSIEQKAKAIELVVQRMCASEIDLMLEGGRCDVKNSVLSFILNLTPQDAALLDRLFGCSGSPRLTGNSTSVDQMAGLEHFHFIICSFFDAGNRAHLKSVVERWLELKTAAQSTRPLSQSEASKAFKEAIVTMLSTPT